MDFSVAYYGHKILESIVDIECTLSQWTDYGLPMIDNSLLRIANTPETECFVQAEIKAIKEGLEYKETKDYKGYVNKNGQMHGVGIKIHHLGGLYIGEFY
jgi:hypothetical protein